MSQIQESQPSGSTSHTLLERVRRSDPEAWRKFVEVYGPLVAYWCRRPGLQADDVADVVQETFRAVARNIDRFRHDREQGSFRGWLRTIVTNKLRDWVRADRRRPTAIGGDDAYRCLLESPDLLAIQTGSDDEVCEQSIIFHGSLALIRAEFNDHTWQAFWRLAVDAAPPSQVAQELTSRSRTSTSVKAAC
jgi:RNA polymerase sigma-70 factor (ECF subfamily)